MPSEESGQEPSSTDGSKDKAQNNEAGASPLAPSVGLPPNPPHPPTGQNDSYEEKKYRLDRKVFRVAKITLVFVGIYTGIAGYEAYQSWSASRLDERAWVGVANITNVSIEADKPPMFNVIVNNSGKTPALHVHVIVQVKTEDNPFIISFFPDTLRMPTGVQSEVTVQPNQPILTSGASQDQIIPKTVTDALSTKTAMAFIYGRITYEDIFGKPHETTFCAMVLPDLHSWQWYSSYNEAD